MALLDDILGGGNGVGGILGNNDSSDTSASADESSTVIGTNPQFGTHLSDVLHSHESDSEDGEESSFTGIGDASIGFAAPTFLGTSSSSQDFNQSETDGSNGGLLGGIF
jgi:hypothetical protein